MHEDEDQVFEAHGSPGTFLASGHAGLVQRAGTQWWPPGLHGQRHMNTWMYQSLADEAVGAIPLDALSKNVKQLEKSCQMISPKSLESFKIIYQTSWFRLVPELEALSILEAQTRDSDSACFAPERQAARFVYCQVLSQSDEADLVTLES